MDGAISEAQQGGGAGLPVAAAAPAVDAQGGMDQAAVGSVAETPPAAASPSAEMPREGKRDDRLRKKAEKSIEQLLKALNDLKTPEEKLAFMCKKCAELYEENRRLQYGVKQSEKRGYQLMKEKDHLQAEHSKAILTRSRLESLCRELQKQNKAVKDESLMRIREGEEKQKEVSAKFQSTLTEINSLMQQNTEKNAKLREENIEMAKKLKSLCEQYESREQVREQHVEKLLKHKELELQLSEAKLAKNRMEMAEERETFLREKQQLLLELTEYQKKCQDLQTSELGLRSQLQMYTEKYDDFQKALTRSNDIFASFKSEMEKMAKKIRKLEKETQSWKQKWETSNAALLQLAADKQRRDTEVKAATKQIGQLEKLCRALQAERNSLLSQLRAFETAVSTQENTPAESNTSAANVEKLKEECCKELKDQIEELHLDENSQCDVKKMGQPEENLGREEQPVEQEMVSVNQLPAEEVEKLFKEQEVTAKQMEQLLQEQRDIDKLKEEQDSIWETQDPADSPAPEDVSPEDKKAEESEAINSTVTKQVEKQPPETEHKVGAAKDEKKGKECGRKRRKK